jgi:hypothetical protein
MEDQAKTLASAEASSPLYAVVLSSAMASSERNRGPKKARAGGPYGKQKPQYHCDNCKKDRYTVCGCRRKK